MGRALSIYLLLQVGVVAASLLVRGFSPTLASILNMVVDYFTYGVLVVFLAIRVGRRLGAIAGNVIAFWLLVAAIVGMKYSLAIAWSEHISLSIGVLEYQLYYAKNLAFITLASIGLVLAYWKIWPEN